MTDENEAPIGYLVGGGLKENLRVRLTISPQEVQEGAFVILESGDWLFYGLVTDFQLGATDPRFADEPRALPMNRAKPACRPASPACFTGKPCSPTWKCCQP